MSGYRWRGGDEGWLRLGPDDAALTVVVLPALFEEANRMRRFTVEMMRALANHGIASVLPDLPGTGDSLVETADVRIDDWHDAAAACAEAAGATISVAVRGGALCDGWAARRWRLDPIAGAAILRDMARATAFSSGQSARELVENATRSGAMLAGNHLSAPLACALSAAGLEGEARVVVVGEGATPRDATLTGTKLWRLAEPGEDATLSALCAADIAAWAAGTA